MASIVSLAIGSTSFAIKLFETALSAYNIFTTAKGFGKDVGVLQAQLIIQEQLLARWGDGLGLTKGEDEVDERLKSETSLFNAVVAGLSSIKLILLDVEKLKKRYGVEASEETADRGVLLLELASTNLMDGETLLREHEMRKHDFESTQKRLSIMKKLRWAVKDKQSFEGLISQLVLFNNGLYSLIPPLDAKILAKSILSELLRTTNLERVWNIKLAAQGSNADIASAASLRHLSLTIARRQGEVPNMQLPGSSQRLNVSGELVAPRRSVGSYLMDVDNQEQQARTENVLIEWKIVASTLTGELKATLETGVNNLAHFLHQSNKPIDLRALNCLGFIKTGGGANDHLKYGLVYEAPDGSSDQSLPISLFELLPKDEDDETSQEFDLGDKFRTAQMIAQSVYELHIGNWLHKAICSDNILYFQQKGGLTKRAPKKLFISSPYVAGYESARTGRLRDATQKAGSITFNLYAHPAYRSGTVKYRRLFDIYSLGVVLLEIGLWKRVESGVTARQTPEDVRKMLIETCSDELGPAMGAIYRDVVRCCLQGDFPVDGLAVNDEPEPAWESLKEEEIAALKAQDERINGELTASFYWKVVRMLGKCWA